MREVIRIKKIQHESVGKKSINKSGPEDYHVVLRHFQGLMIDRYHQNFRGKTNQNNK